ncbi:MAG: YkvA family protein [Leptolyngbyaceae cyanobacterium]
MRFFIEGYRRLLTHPRYGVWVLLGTLLYVVSPIDISPDVLPIFGQIDDVALIVLLVSAASQWLSQQFLASQTTDSSTTTSEEETIQQTIDIDAVEVKPTE